MANPEHVAILDQGVDAWNEWRRQFPEVKPDLSHEEFMGCVLDGADLHSANLFYAYCMSASAVGADFRGANLEAADLYGADLTKAKLDGANMSGCQLSLADLTDASLTGTHLYGAAHDDWEIAGIRCRYAFWDMMGEIRSPKDRDLAPGEFEQLYRSLPTIEYVFQNGMTPLDPLIMDRVVHAVREHNPEYDIKIDSIIARGLAPSIKFTVQLDEHKEPALQMIAVGYERRLRQVEDEKNRLYDLLALAIDKVGTKLLVAGGDILNAEDNAAISIDQHIEYITNLRDALAAVPEDSPTFTTVTKKTALDMIGSALKDVAKGQVKEAAKQIYELGKDLGPVIVNTAAYGFFKNCLGL